MQPSQNLRKRRPSKYPLVEDGTPPCDYFSIRHAAEKFDVSTDFIRDHIEKGTIRTVVLKSASGNGTRQPVRIPVEELEALIAEHRAGLDDLVHEAFTK